MAKFIALYKSDASASELMANSTPEQIQASMQEWITWKEDLPEAISHEWGVNLAHE